MKWFCFDEVLNRLFLLWRVQIVKVDEVRILIENFLTNAGTASNKEDEEINNKPHLAYVGATIRTSFTFDGMSPSVKHCGSSGCILV